MTGLHALPFRLLLACLAIAALLIALPLSAGELYQWKDAQGVTHYSDAPPADGAYENRRITNSGANIATETSDEAPVENSQCATARANLELLQGEGPVAVEGSADDAEGEPTAMSDAQRAAQRQLAEAAIAAYCTEDAAL